MYSYQHKYISQTPPVNNLQPWSINKTVKTLMDEVLDKYTDHPIPFLFLSDSEPYCFAPWVDVTRAPLGFEREAIPNLKKNLLQMKSDVHLAQALCALTDLLKDPEKSCEALRLNILQALVRLMHHKNMFIRIKTLDVLEVLASAPFGRSTITKNPYIMKQLKNNMFDTEDLVRSQAYRTLRILSANWFAVENIVKQHFVQHILQALKIAMSNTSSKAQEHLYYLLGSLEYLLDYNDEVKMESIRFDIFDLKDMINHQNLKVREAALGVFTQLGKHKLGREGCIAHGIVNSLHPQNYKEDDQMQAKVYGTLMFTTALIKGKKDAIDKNLHIEALQVLTNLSPPHLKRNAAKVLTNLAKMPSANKELQPFLDLIVNIPIGNDKVLENQINELVELLDEGK